VLDPIGRFFLGTAIAFSLAAIWPIVFFVACWKCRENSRRWMRHELTYGLIHHAVFPFAVGLFAARFEWAVCMPDTNHGRFFAIGFLILLFVLMLFISFEDLTHGHLISYELADPCAEFAKRDKLEELANNVRMLQAGPEREAAERDAKQSETAYIAERKKIGVRDTLRKSNCVTVVNAFLTIAFQLFCAVVLWYSIMLVVRNPPNLNAHAAKTVLVLVFLSTWIPARIYVNYYQREFDFVPVDDRAAIFASVIAVLVFSVFVAAGFGNQPIPPIAGIVVGAVAFFLKQSPKTLKRIRTEIDGFHLPMSVGIFVVAGAVFFAVAYNQIK